MDDPDLKHYASVGRAVAKLHGSATRFAPMFEHGDTLVGLYAPRGEDPQGPHEQDEVYVVVAGTGTFVNGDRRHGFAPGDVMFVPAGQEHRFEDFSDDFQAWVVFFGPPK